MTLAEISIRRPVFAWMIMFALMFFGVICFMQLGVSQLPEATPPQLTIDAEWNGAAPEVMETQIVNPIEQAVVSVQGLTDLNAGIRQGTARIHLTFDTGKNIDAALQETNSKLRSVALPSDILPPTIEKENTDDNPIMWLAVTSSKRSFKDILTYVDLHLRDRLRVIPGVGDVYFGGWSDRNLRVWVDNTKLLDKQLTILDVRNTLKMENSETSSGYLENGVNDTNVRVKGEALTPEQMGDILITQRGGQRIYHSNIHLRDIARVEDGLDDVRSLAWSDGRVTLGLGIVKQHGENDVKVGMAVRAFVAEIDKEIAVSDPDLNLYVSFDSTRFTGDAIHETEITVLLSIIVTRPRLLGLPRVVDFNDQRAAFHSRFRAGHVHRHADSRFHHQLFHAAGHVAGHRHRGRRRDHGAGEHRAPFSHGQVGAAGGARRRAGNFLRRRGRDYLGHHGFRARSPRERLHRRLSCSSSA